MKPGKVNHQEMQREKVSATSAQTMFRRWVWLRQVEPPLTEATFFKDPEETRLGGVLCRGRGSTKSVRVCRRRIVSVH